MKDYIVDHLTRMMRLLKLLETSERTIPNLALEIDISPRTVIRYMDVFRSIGYCIVRNDLNEYTLLNDYGVPRLRLTKNEVENLITSYIEYCYCYSSAPSPSIETTLFKIAESISPNMISFLKENLRLNDGEVISNMFNPIDPQVTSYSMFREPS